MKTYGYIRVSSTDQNEDRQLLAMNELEILPENIVIDKQSGKNFERAGYQMLVKNEARRFIVCIEHRPFGAQL